MTVPIPAVSAVASPDVKDGWPVAVLYAWRGSPPIYDSPMSPNKQPVTVIGLGLMGSALARTFLSAGYELTVWNRTAEKAEPFDGPGRVADLGDRHPGAVAHSLVSMAIKGSLSTS